jgi:hypothetical protein
MAQRVKVASFDAVGGPSALQTASDGYFAGPTDAGIYRMARCGKHSSPSYPDWSKVRWGSEIKEADGEIKVFHEGKWRLLKEVSPHMTKEALIRRNLELYGKYELPKSWIFNDFGHITCYFFRDKNGNARLDKDLGEKIHTEYFHTTPDDEAATAAGKPVSLSQSHGCIHLKPNDIDEMNKKGYFDAGNMVVVHGYDEKVPLWEHDPASTAPFELHFFPGARKVIVTGRRPPPARH